MSRSKHQTLKSVFGDKSKAEIDAMLLEGEEDAMELLAKRRIKKDVTRPRSQRGDKD